MPEPAQLTDSQLRIAAECDRIKAMLLRKNALYGDSALKGLSVFSKLPTMEKLAVRIDDKLSRINNMGFKPELQDDGEWTLDDLIGYFVLINVQSQKEREEEMRLQDLVKTTAISPPAATTPPDESAKVTPIPMPTRPALDPPLEELPRR